ncbi:hypothetical protein ACFV09_42050, partial [Streptomyces sp. NPDC059631]|uniref:hypothetical protein n=1 Tax=Streptomyces sp. NPDC059631 TaxID=3346890 RepID=UPI0036B92D66
DPRAAGELAPGWAFRPLKPSDHACGEPGAAITDSPSVSNTPRFVASCDERNRRQPGTTRSPTIEQPVDPKAFESR